jgi:hypothetical protein
MRRNGYSAATFGAAPSVVSVAHSPDILVARRDTLTELLGGDDRLPEPEVQSVDPAVVGDLYALITASGAGGRSGVAGGCAETGSSCPLSGEWIRVVEPAARRTDKRRDLGSLAARPGWATCGLPCGSPA